MKIKLSHVGIAAVVLLSALTSFASRKNEVTLVMVPRDEVSVKVGMDLANRYPTLLLSYQVAVSGAVSLHGWTGTQWVNVTVADFQAGNFFRTGPDSALLVEKDGVSIPESILPPEEWAPFVYKVTTSKVRPLLHLAGRYFDFKYKDWQWFSKRYNLPLEAINPAGLNISWYQKPLKDHLSGKSSSVEFDDLQYWVELRAPVALPVADLKPVAEEVDMAPPSEAIESGEVVNEVSEEPAPREPEINPLTNAVPEALVLGVGDADEMVGSPDDSKEAAGPE